MSKLSDVEQADRVSRKRARLLIFLAILFLTGQAIFFTHDQNMNGASATKVAAWLIWAIVLLAFLATGGGLLLRKSVRSLVNDETARHNRMRAYKAGFWAAMIMAVILYVVTIFDTVTGREAIHVIVTTAVGAALMTFGSLEKRSFANG